MGMWMPQLVLMRSAGYEFFAAGKMAARIAFFCTIPSFCRLLMSPVFCLLRPVSAFFF